MGILPLLTPSRIAGVNSSPSPIIYEHLKMVAGMLLAISKSFRFRLSIDNTRHLNRG